MKKIGGLGDLGKKVPVTDPGGGMIGLSGVEKTDGRRIRIDGGTIFQHVVGIEPGHSVLEGGFFGGLDIEAVNFCPPTGQNALVQYLRHAEKWCRRQSGCAGHQFFLLRRGLSFPHPDQLPGLFCQDHPNTANFFHDLGVGPRDVVSYLLPNLPETHYVLWGGEAVGIINPINSMLAPSTIRDICLAANTKVLVALADLPETDIWAKFSQIRKEIPSLQAVVRVMGPSEEKEGIYGLGESLDRYPGHHLLSGRSIDPEDLASMYHTGGTTGTPKLAPHTHYNEAAMAFILDSVSLLSPGEATLCGLPLFHVNGTTITGSFPFSIGAHVVILSSRGYRDPEVMKNFYKIVEYYKAVTFSAVPTILSVLLDIPKEEADISSLRYLACGAAPLSVELFKRFEAHSQMKILEGYGLTEGTCASCLNPFHGDENWDPLV